MADGREPLCLAFVLCDGVYSDPWTGRKSLMGLLSEFVAVDFPCTLPGLAVHLVLTECRGTVRLLLRVIDGNEEREPVAWAEYDLDTSSPLDPAEHGHLFADLQFPQPGEYRVQLFAGGMPLAERRLTILPTALGDDHAG